jgi:3-oxoacyl-[acyl-carrier-protein] synthase II
MRGFVKWRGRVPALLFWPTVSNAPASLCAIEFAMRGPNVTFNQREASSLAALMCAATAVREGRVAAMLTGGADRVDEMLFKVYDRFRVLSPRVTGSAEGARPFDAARNGFVLGEGGFMLLLESETSAAARGVPVLRDSWMRRLRRGRPSTPGRRSCRPGARHALRAGRRPRG